MYSNNFWNCANSKRSKIASCSLDKRFEFDAYVMNPCQCSVACNFVVNHKAADIVGSLAERQFL